MEGYKVYFRLGRYFIAKEESGKFFIGKQLKQLGCYKEVWKQG